MYKLYSIAISIAAWLANINDDKNTSLSIHAEVWKNCIKLLRLF